MKKKLSFEEQIMDLESKNVHFELSSKEDAQKFLQYNNYYFKLKSYAHNYSKYSKVGMQHKYINLDFAYLVELSDLDMHLRKLIVNLCLDIEHFLKVRLMRDIVANPKEDGYHIVCKFVEQDYSVLTNLYKNLEGAANSDLIKKFHENEDKIPVWGLIEALSFGRFIELYNLYYGIYGGHSYASYLGNVKFLRNAAAHNTCLINSLRKPYIVKINKNREIMDTLSKTQRFASSYKTKMENPVIHNFVVLLFVYWDVFNTPRTREFRAQGIQEIKKLFFETMVRGNNKEYFGKNDVIVESYKFICEVIQYLESCRNAPVLKND